MRVHLLLVAGLLLAALCTSPTLAADGPQRVAMRGFGTLTVTPRFYGAGAQRTSWITFAAQDATHAALCGSKFRADLLGYGDLREVTGSGLPGTLITLPGAGQWLLGLQGASCHVLFARTQPELAALATRAGAKAWTPVTARAYPPWLDCLDNAAMGFWFLGGGVLPQDVNADFAWLGQHGFSACVVGTDETRLLAPGVMDTSVADWYSAMAKKHNVPYRMLLGWTEPRRPEMLWNRVPLPYVQAGEAGTVYPDLQHEKNAVYNAFEPIPATDAYTADFRKQMAAYVGKDPYFMGHHALAEMPRAGLLELAPVAGMPATQAAWRSFLRDTRGLSLAAVGERYFGDPRRYTRWEDVALPSMKDFLGWGADSVDLVGIWEGKADREKLGTAAKWYAPESAPADWVKVSCNDPMLMIYNGNNPADYWLRRTVTLTAAQATALKFLHISYNAWHGSGNQPSDVYVNGQPMKSLAVMHPLWGDPDQTYALAGLRAGENTLVLNTHGNNVPSYIFFSQVGRWDFPSPDARQNRRWTDTVDFSLAYRLRGLEQNLQATRAGDADRPMKIMAPWGFMDQVLDLCLQYGAYAHDTGQGGACWGPWMPRYSLTRGVVTSSEPGGPGNTPQELQQMMTFYLMLGNSAVDTVFHADLYRTKPELAKWIADNREMLRCIGKMEMRQPGIGVLRSNQSTRLFAKDPWSWDIGRGELQGVGRQFNYAELPDFRNGAANQFRVIVDDGTNILSNDDVDAIARYVKQGGIFVALHNTGMHTPDASYTWPISRLTGLKVMNKGRAIGGVNLRFNDAQTLWPSLRGKEIQGWGMVLDWRKDDLTGDSLALAKDASDVQVVAEWAKPPQGQGNIAVATRKLGKGLVITLGSTFWRSAADVNGHWEGKQEYSNYLDELMTSLGVPREGWNTAGPLSREVWAEHWVSKNGVYDVYPVARINTDAKQPPLTTNIRLQRDAAISEVRDLAANDHAASPVTMANGSFTLSGVTLAPMQSHVYVAPRADLERAALNWVGTQSRQWYALPKTKTNLLPPAPKVPADTLPLAEGWLMTTGQTDTAWTQPGFAATGWKTVKLGSFAAMNLPEDGVAQFRREITLPKAWAGQRVTLHFNSQFWFWGIWPQGKLWINGQPAAIKQPIRADQSGSFTLELTEQAQTGKLILALELDGRVPQGQKRLRPSGATGTFFLLAEPKPVQVTPLDKWLAASDVNVFKPVTVGQSAKYAYLETRFTLPATWPGTRLFLESPGHLGFITLNDHVITTPPWMKTLDVSNLVRRDGENVLRWLPARTDVPSYRNIETRAVQALSLSWRP